MPTRIVCIGIQHPENPDGSKRCITQIKPKLQSSKPALRVGFRDWDSQALVSEVFIILLYELMGIQIERYYDIESGSDGIYALGERRCDLILESWDTVRYTEPLDKYVLNKNNSVRWIRGMGYGARNGWYVNNGAAFQENTALNIYASYKQADVIKKLNNASIYSQTETYFNNCSSKTPNAQSSKYCNARTGTFSNPKCNNVDCGKVLAAKLSWVPNLIHRQILGLDLNLAVTWIGTDGITKLVPEHLHSEEPFLFYWWYPDKFTAGPAGEARIKFPTYRKDLWETTGACDFPESDIDKLVHVSVSPVIQLFLENFKLSDADVNKLLNSKRDASRTGKLLATF